jgi:hypothetical protein
VQVAVRGELGWLGFPEWVDGLGAEKSSFYDFGFTVMRTFFFVCRILLE